MVAWLTSLGLGACLADDMGLGKTIQVLALLLHLRLAGRTWREGFAGVRSRTSRDADCGVPSLIVAPLLSSTTGVRTRAISPALSLFVAHPSETSIDLNDEQALEAALAGMDLAITTTESLRERRRCATGAGGCWSWTRRKRSECG